MTQFDFELGDDETVRFNIQLEMYLRGRAEPLQVFAVFDLSASVFSGSTDPVGVLMDHIQIAILNVIDTKGEERMVFADERDTRRVILTREIQAMSLLAPDEQTVLTLIEMAEQSK